ncbi:MAG: DegT/DnrJ/EryC1/StrS family aminotransferase [Chloroflexi bacterium]|nr:DegT/DnrJ/EryC1/StrS family aminotransferase [Chloroflexota bacterium]
MIPIAEPILGEAEMANVVQAVKSTWISSKGEFIPLFEKQFAGYCGAKHGVAVSNGTVALHLALKAMDIKEGDEVIVPTLTFIATANAVRYVGATPVFVDSHPEYWCIDPSRIRGRITKRTRVIIPVHLYGHPCDMDAINTLAKEFGLRVIEDAAEAHGALYKGKKVGGLSHISCFSFYGNKLITTGEGGMCLTSDRLLAERMQALRDHSMNPVKRYWHDEVGFNYRMTNIQAAIGVAQLQRLDEFIEQKRRLVGWYNSRLGEVSGVTCPPQMPWARSVYWIYSVLLSGCSEERRDRVMAGLMKDGIETRPIFYPIHIQPPYSSGERYPEAERIGACGISLPSALTLTEDNVDYVCQRLVARLRS